MTRDEGHKELTERYMELYAYSFNLLKNRVDAEDVLHDALAETLSRNWLRNPYGYCVRVIRNKSINLLREQGSYRQIREDLVEETHDDEEHQDVMAKMSRLLKPQLRELIEMHDIGEMTMREISIEKGMSLSNVKKLINKAHKILRKSLL